jgi:hypothetical protein
VGRRRRCRRPTDVGRETILPYPYPYPYPLKRIENSFLCCRLSLVVAYQIIDYGEDGEDRHILVDYIKC